MTKEEIKKYCTVHNIHCIKCKSPYHTIDINNIDYMLDENNQATMEAFIFGSWMECFKYNFNDYKKTWVFIDEEFE